MPIQGWKQQLEEKLVHVWGGGQREGGGTLENGAVSLTHDITAGPCLNALSSVCLGRDRVLCLLPGCNTSACPEPYNTNKG